MLGLIAPVSALAVFPNNLIMCDSVTGEEITRIPLGAAFRRKFHHPYALIHRADLHKVLLEACRKSGRIRLDASQKVVKVDETGGGVAVTTESGKHYRGAALIGADGLWSTIRQMIVGDGKPKPAGHITYRAVLPTSEMPEQYRWQRHGVLGRRKSASGALSAAHRRIVQSRRGVSFQPLRGRLGQFRRSGRAARALRQDLRTGAHAAVNKIESWRMWVLCDRPPIKEWSSGRITLLGDAAHPMLQYLAQGAGMSIEDAVCLADKVVAANGDYAAAFRAYQQARYLRTGRVQIMARIYGEFYHASGVAKELRNMMLGSRTPDDAMAGMEWLYGEQKELTRAAALA